MDVVLDRPAHQVRRLLGAIRLHVGRRDSDQLRAADREEAGDLWELDVGADADAEAEWGAAGRPDGEIEQRVRVAAGECVDLAIEQMGLAIRPDDPPITADDDRGVERSGRVGRVGLDDAGDDRDRVRRGGGGERADRGAVERLREIEHGAAQGVTLDEAFREDDEIGFPLRRAPDVASGEGQVCGDVADRRADLGDRDDDFLDAARLSRHGGSSPSRRVRDPDQEPEDGDPEQPRDEQGDPGDERDGADDEVTPEDRAARHEEIAQDPEQEQDPQGEVHAGDCAASDARSRTATAGLRPARARPRGDAPRPPSRRGSA